MDQKQIVRERLQYHFKQPDGNWNIPNEMPFMKEFLNEVEKIASDGDLVEVSHQRELLIAFCKHGGIQSLVPTKAESIEQLVDDYLSN